MRVGHVLIAHSRRRDDGFVFSSPAQVGDHRGPFDGSRCYARTPVPAEPHREASGNLSVEAPAHPLLAGVRY